MRGNLSLSMNNHKSYKILSNSVYSVTHTPNMLQNFHPENSCCPVKITVVGGGRGERVWVQEDFEMDKV